MPTVKLSARQDIQVRIERLEDAIDREQLKPNPDDGAIANLRAQIGQLEERFTILDADR